MSEEQLEVAACQAKSYALFLGFSSFVVGAPEGLWLFSLDRGVHKLVMKLGAKSGKSEEENFRSMLVKLSR